MRLSGFRPWIWNKLLEVMEQSEDFLKGEFSPPPFFLIMTKELVIASLAFSLFVVCPRMAGMMQIIAKHCQTSLLATVLGGTLISIPILVVMVFTFEKFGLWGALLFCVLTDVGAAGIMSAMSFKAAIETAIIALFVILGVKVAPFVSKLVGG